MRYSLIQLRAFANKWRAARLDDEDLRALERAIIERPDAGAVIQGAGGLRKLRFAPPSRGKGKSGSMRVCYAVYREFGRVYLVTLFSKNQQDNLAPEERSAIKGLLARISRALSQGEEP